MVVFNVSLFESLNQDVSALFLFLLSLFLVEGVASETQVPHYLVVHLQ
jgi:hypothetical protein